MSCSRASSCGENLWPRSPCRGYLGCHPEVSALRVPPALTEQDVGQPAMGKDVQMQEGEWPWATLWPMELLREGCPPQDADRPVRHKGRGFPGALTDHHTRGLRKSPLSVWQHHNTGKQVWVMKCHKCSSAWLDFQVPDIHLEVSLQLIWKKFRQV